MRKITFLLLAACLIFASIKAFADVTIYFNGGQKGRVESLNLKGCNTTRTGQTGVIDCTNIQAAVNFNQGIAGINWSAIPQGYATGINWTGADINFGGLNWQDIHVLATKYGDHSGINWQAIPGS